MNKIFILLLLVIISSCNRIVPRSEREKQVEKYYSTRYEGAKNNIIDKYCKVIIPKLDSITTISVETETGSMNPLYFFRNIASTKYIALQTTEKSLMSGINLVKFAPNRIFCISNVDKKSITIFDGSGLFINKIENVGKGPEEYLSISQVAIDYKKSNVVIMDLNANKLIRFDYDGKYVSTQKIFFYFSDFIFSKNSEHIFYSSDIENNMHIKPIEAKRLICTKEENELIYASINLPSEYVFAHFSVLNFSYYGDEILYFPNFSDTIYTVDSCQVIAKYKVKHKGNNLKLEDCNMQYFNNFQQNFVDDNIFRLRFPAIETGKYVFLVFDQGGRSFYSLYSKKTKLAETGFIIAADKDVAPVYGYPIAVHNDCFVSTIDAERIVKGIQDKSISDEYLEKNPDLKKIAEQITINDNPVMVFYTPK